MDPSFVSAEEDRQRELGLIESEEDAQDEKARSSEFSIESNESLAMKGLEFLRGPDSALSNYVKMNFPLLPQEGVAAFVDYLTTREMLSEAGFHIGMMDLIRAEVCIKGAETSFSLRFYSHSDILPKVPLLTFKDINFYEITSPIHITVINFS